MKKSIVDRSYNQLVADSAEWMNQLIPNIWSTMVYLSACRDDQFKSIEDLRELELDVTMFEDSGLPEVDALARFIDQFMPVVQSLSNLNNLALDVYGVDEMRPDYEEYQREWMESRGLTFSDNGIHESMEKPGEDEPKDYDYIPFESYASLSPSKRYKKLKKQVLKCIIETYKGLVWNVFFITGKHYSDIYDTEEDINVQLICDALSLLTGAIWDLDGDLPSVV